MDLLSTAPDALSEVIAVVVGSDEHIDELVWRQVRGGKTARRYRICKVMVNFFYDNGNEGRFGSSGLTSMHSKRLLGRRQCMNH